MANASAKNTSDHGKGVLFVVMGDDAEVAKRLVNEWLEINDAHYGSGISVTALLQLCGRLSLSILKQGNACIPPRSDLRLPPSPYQPLQLRAGSRSRSPPQFDDLRSRSPTVERIGSVLTSMRYACHTWLAACGGILNQILCTGNSAMLKGASVRMACRRERGT